MDIIQNKTFDEERALYGRRNILVRDCAFDGPADGESAFKAVSYTHLDVYKRQVWDICPWF